jgi:hypothetical protein
VEPANGACTRRLQLDSFRNVASEKLARKILLATSERANERATS